MLPQNSHSKGRLRSRFISYPSLIGLVAFCLVVPNKCLPAIEGDPIPAKALAQTSAPGYEPGMAVDGNEATLWLASLDPSSLNNNVWFQLDLGSVRQVARLHWIAAAGTPYPASAPSNYHVDVSNDSVLWNTVFTNTGLADQMGNVALNTNARYVRLVTTQINDGTGWALGLREMWVTEGNTSAELMSWHLHAEMSDRKIEISWQPNIDKRATRLSIYRSAVPTSTTGTLITTIDAAEHGYSDNVSNWMPYYYWIQALDNKGAVLDTSGRVAAFAHPDEGTTPRIETFAFWYEPYKPVADPDASIRHIGNAAFVVGPDIKPGSAELSKSGIALLPYMTLYQTGPWVGSFGADVDPKAVAGMIAPIAFFQKTASFPGGPKGYIPTVFCRPGNIEYNSKAIQYTTCPNSASFRNMVLQYVENQLAAGVTGFFVDNGYADDIAASAACQSNKHVHYYGDDLTSSDAFIGMLMEVSCAIKKRNQRGIIMVNGGVPSDANYYGLTLGDVSDGQLWESYLRTSYNTAQEHVSDWETVYRRSIESEKAWLAVPPRRMYVLSYPWNRDEAFFCYATAKLCNLPWSANLGIGDRDHMRFGGHFGTYPELINLRLGSPLDTRQYGGEKIGEVYLRRYERGLVVVNPSAQEQRLVVPMMTRSIVRDVFSDRSYQGGSISLSLPPKSGRVYLVQ